MRVLHPEPMTLLAATRELAVQDRPARSAEAQRSSCPCCARRSAAHRRGTDRRGLPGHGVGPGERQHHADPPVPRPGTAEPQAGQGKAARRRWLPVAAIGLIGALLVAGIIVAVASAGADQAPAAPRRPSPARLPQPLDAADPADVRRVRRSRHRRPRERDAGPHRPRLRGEGRRAGRGLRGGHDRRPAAVAGPARLRPAAARPYLVTTQGKQAAVLLAVLTLPGVGPATTFKGRRRHTGQRRTRRPGGSGHAVARRPRPDFDSRRLRQQPLDGDLGRHRPDRRPGAADDAEARRRGALAAPWPGGRRRLPPPQ